MLFARDFADAEFSHSNYYMACYKIADPALCWEGVEVEAYTSFVIRMIGQAFRPRPMVVGNLSMDVSEGQCSFISAHVIFDFHAGKFFPDKPARACYAVKEAASWC